MKKALLIICAVLITIMAQAQEHMTFKGIPMNCDLSTFVAKLEAKGYVKIYEKNSGAVLSGDFAGKSDCKIFVLSTEDSKHVWKIAVKFPEQTSWYSLKNEYSTFKTSYTEKYGKPNVYEFFSSPYYEGDGYELQALRLEKCTYVSYFSTPQGDIALEMTTDKCIRVSYEDAINVNIRQGEKDKAVSSDI